MELLLTGQKRFWLVQIMASHVVTGQLGEMRGDFKVNVLIHNAGGGGGGGGAEWLKYFTR